jgi:lipopolysaccharide export LptBFGC system permease protein LptF
MAHEWFEELARAMGDSLPHAIRDFRTENQFGCMFAFAAILGVVILLIFALGNQPLGQGGWWTCVGLIGVGAVGAAICFWLGSRPKE